MTASIMTASIITASRRTARQTHGETERQTNTLTPTKRDRAERHRVTATQIDGERER